MDRIGKLARDVCELVRGDKLFVISLTGSVMEPGRNGTLLAFRNGELTFATFSGSISG